MFDPEDDDITPEEYAEIEAGLEEAGFLNEDGTMNREVIDHDPGVPLPEIEEMLAAHYGEERETDDA